MGDCYLEADRTPSLGQTLGAILLVFLLPEREEASPALLLVPPPLAPLLLRQGRTGHTRLVSNSIIIIIQFFLSQNQSKCELKL